MNPLNNNESMQLPAPVEQPLVQIVGEQPTNPAGPEVGLLAERPELNLQPSPLSAAPANPLPTMSTDDDVTHTHTATANGNPLQASDDADLIEKEWVNKAKAIVEQNKNDPYKEAEELNVFKADYMKKRYNRTIKLK